MRKHLWESCGHSGEIIYWTCAVCGSDVASTDVPEDGQGRVLVTTWGETRETIVPSDCDVCYVQVVQES